MRIHEHFSLLNYNTFKIDVLCNQFVEIENDSEMDILFEKNFFDDNYLIIGGGSNILFTRPFEGTVVKMITKGIELVDASDDCVVLDVSAGVEWADFVDYCIGNQYYGVENLIGIPGLVGSAPVQNIGAYGAEVKDVIDSVRGIRISTRIPFAFARSECDFGYRQSVFKTILKNDAIITHVRFKLSRIPKFNLSYQGLQRELEKSNVPLTLSSVADAVIAVRNSKLPDIRKYGCAGSFFKNPIVPHAVLTELSAKFPKIVSYPVDDSHVKLAAGQLIDLAGLKGWREGNVGVWPLQALVIVNYEGATGREICNFYAAVQQKVYSLTGIWLEPEVNVI